MMTTNSFVPRTVEVRPQIYDRPKGGRQQTPYRPQGGAINTSKPISLNALINSVTISIPKPLKMLGIYIAIEVDMQTGRLKPKLFQRNPLSNDRDEIKFEDITQMGKAMGVLTEPKRFDEKVNKVEEMYYSLSLILSKLSNDNLFNVPQNFQQDFAECKLIAENAVRNYHLIEVIRGEGKFDTEVRDFILDQCRRILKGLDTFMLRLVSSKDKVVLSAVMNEAGVSNFALNKFGRTVLQSVKQIGRYLWTANVDSTFVLTVSELKNSVIQKSHFNMICHVPNLICQASDLDLMKACYAVKDSTATDSTIITDRAARVRIKIPPRSEILAEWMNSVNIGKFSDDRDDLWKAVLNFPFRIASCAFENDLIEAISRQAGIQLPLEEKKNLRINMKRTLLVDPKNPKALCDLADNYLPMVKSFTILSPIADRIEKAAKIILPSRASILSDTNKVEIPSYFRGGKKNSGVDPRIVNVLPIPTRKEHTQTFNVNTTLTKEALELLAFIRTSRNASIRDSRQRITDYLQGFYSGFMQAKVAYKLHAMIQNISDQSVVSTLREEFAATESFLSSYQKKRHVRVIEHDDDENSDIGREEDFDVENNSEDEGPGLDAFE